MKPTFTKLILVDGQLVAAPADFAGPHKYVRLEHPLLANPLELLVAAPPKDVTQPQAVKWAEDLDEDGFKFRLIAAEEAFLIPDRGRTTYPLTDAEMLPNHANRWIWTSTVDLVPPLGGAFIVLLGGGVSARNLQDDRYCALAVRVGQ